MARFTQSRQRYNQLGQPIPKGRNELKEYKEKNPNDIIFDSKAEYLTYIDLLTLQEKGEIRDLQIQVRFGLISGRKWWNNVKGRWEVIRPLDYIADFVFYRGEQKVVLDCKNWKQKVDKKTGKEKWTCYYDDIYKIKRKILLEKYDGQFIFEEI
jgi:hypothetical protein